MSHTGRPAPCYVISAILVALLCALAVSCWAYGPGGAPAPESMSYKPAGSADSGSESEKPKTYKPAGGSKSEESKPSQPAPAPAPAPTPPPPSPPPPAPAPAPAPAPKPQPAPAPAPAPAPKPEPTPPAPAPAPAPPPSAAGSYKPDTSSGNADKSGGSTGSSGAKTGPASGISSGGSSNSQGQSGNTGEQTYKPSGQQAGGTSGSQEKSYKPDGAQSGGANSGGSKKPTEGYKPSQPVRRGPSPSSTVNTNPPPTTDQPAPVYTPEPSPAPTPAPASSAPSLPAQGFSPAATIYKPDTPAKPAKDTPAQTPEDKPSWDDTGYRPDRPQRPRTYKPPRYDYWADHYDRERSRRSCYYDYGIYPYVEVTRIVEVPYPEVVYVDRPVYEAIPYMPGSGALDALDEAFSNIRRAFLVGRYDLIEKHVRIEDTIAVLLEGEYDYSVMGEDYLAMTHDALETLETVGFVWEMVRPRSDDAITGFAQHSYYQALDAADTTAAEKQDPVKSVYASFTLRKVDGVYCIVEVGVSKNKPY